jgi:arginyl-tRNA synthetase
MAVPSFAHVLSQRVAAAVSDAPVGWSPGVRRSRVADFQADGPFGLARASGIDPRAFVSGVAARVAGSAVGGPGFLNLTLTDRELWEQVAARLDDVRLGVGVPEAGGRTVVDYSQPNIAKEMHVGHLRSTVIGDALARVLAHLGGTVIRQNHIGDWGTQFGMLIAFRMENGTTTQEIAALGELYRRARTRFDSDPDFAERSRARVVALQAGDPATVREWRALVDASTVYFTEVYGRLDVLLTPADIVGESAYNDALPHVAADLERLGVAVPSDGALCVFLDGESAPLIVRKRDGGFGYAATDLAAVRHRVDTLHAERILYVVDVRQAFHLRTVLGSAVRAGWLPAGVEATHVAFGTVLDRTGRPLKTRDGTPERLTDLLDVAVDRAREVVRAKHPDLPDDALEERAAQVGIGALKYADLSNNRARDYVFDPDRMLALNGNTGVYLQYAHARARSVLSRAGTYGPLDPALPPGRHERTLMLQLDAFGDALEEVATIYEPHLLCTYLYGLAQAFAAFWEHCPVLTAPEGHRENRLALCRLTAETLRTGLDLLGVAAPEVL